MSNIHSIFFINSPLEQFEVTSLLSFNTPILGYFTLIFPSLNFSNLDFFTSINIFTFYFLFKPLINLILIFTFLHSILYSISYSSIQSIKDLLNLAAKAGKNTSLFS
jgi:F-type H+-transporting ATPase subunit a